MPCDGSCGGATPLCDEKQDSCVQCLESTRDCEAPMPYCSDAKECVECLDNLACAETTASKCDDGTCSPCETDEDCAHLEGTGVCDAGECVECTTGQEKPCNGKSCDPMTKSCTDTNIGSVGNCRPCAADSECIGGNQDDPERRCIPMLFAGEPREGGFCLVRQSKGCERPYAVIITAASLSGATAEPYCGIDEANVTCEAVLDFQGAQSCVSDADCGCARDDGGSCIAPGRGGLCRVLGIGERCTYQCGTLDDCVSGRACNTDPNPDFCE